MESGPNRYTIKEEIANSITHGIGIVLAIGALCILVTLAGIPGNPWQSSAAIDL
jgi:hemolysin III